MVFWKKINDLFFCVLNFVVASSSQSMRIICHIKEIL